VSREKSVKKLTPTLRRVESSDLDVAGVLAETEPRLFKLGDPPVAEEETIHCDVGDIRVNNKRGLVVLLYGGTLDDGIVFDADVIKKGNGQRTVINLGVPITGKRPRRRTMIGDDEFERSRDRAMEAWGRRVSRSCKLRFLATPE